MMRLLTILFAAIGIVAVVSGGALLASTAKSDFHGIAIAVLLIVIVLFALDLMARHFREIGILEARNEAARLYDERSSQ